MFADDTLLYKEVSVEELQSVEHDIECISKWVSDDNEHSL